MVGPHRPRQTLWGGFHVAVLVSDALERFLDWKNDRLVDE